MALEDRHFKIVFSGEPESLDYLANFYNVYSLFFWMKYAMEFSYDGVFSDFRVPASLLPNGTWTGSIGMMNRSEFDIAIFTTVVTEDRWDALAFNYPFRLDEITFTTNKPRYAPEIMAILRTLSLPVWISLLVSIVVFTLVCFAALKHRCTLVDVVFHVCAIGLAQQGNLVPKRTGEVLLLCTWMSAMLLFSFCFKSVLLSFLSFPPLTGVRTIPELAAAIRSGKFKAVARSPVIGAILLKSPNEDLRVIGEDVLKNELHSIESLFDGKHEDYAYVTDRALLQFAEEKLFVSEDGMGFGMSATSVRKDLCCKQEMDRVVHRFWASGSHLKPSRFLNHRKAVYYFNSIPDDEKVRKITLTDISAAFIFLAAGYCLSACVLVGELWLKGRQRRQSLAKKNYLP